MQFNTCKYQSIQVLRLEDSSENIVQKRLSAGSVLSVILFLKQIKKNLGVWKKNEQGKDDGLMASKPTFIHTDVIMHARKYNKNRSIINGASNRKVNHIVC